MAILRRLARALGLHNLEFERGITVIKLEGYSNAYHVDAFKWLCQELLPQAIKPFVLLDRDYRSVESAKKVEHDFADGGIVAHVWRRKELESYVLTPSVIGRVSGVHGKVAEAFLSDVTLSMENDVFGRLLDEQLREKKSANRHAVEITSAYKKEFDALWREPEFRLASAPAKQVIARLNERLQSAGHKAVSARALASAHRRQEIPEEMASVLNRINESTSDYY
jgi:hypothetical protein